MSTCPESAYIGNPRYAKVSEECGVFVALSRHNGAQMCLLMGLKLPSLSRRIHLINFPHSPWPCRCRQVICLRSIEHIHSWVVTAYHIRHVSTARRPRSLDHGSCLSSPDRYVRTVSSGRRCHAVPTPQYLDTCVWPDVRAVSAQWDRLVRLRFRGGPGRNSRGAACMGVSFCRLALLERIFCCVQIIISVHRAVDIPLLPLLKTRSLEFYL